MARPRSDMLEVEKKLTTLEEDKVVRLVTYDKNLSVLQIHEMPMAQMMYRRGGSSKNRDQMSRPLRQHVVNTLEAGGSAEVHTTW